MLHTVHGANPQRNDPLLKITPAPNNLQCHVRIRLCPRRRSEQLQKILDGCQIRTRLTSENMSDLHYSKWQQKAKSRLPPIVLFGHIRNLTNLTTTSHIPAKLLWTCQTVLNTCCRWVISLPSCPQMDKSYASLIVLFTETSRSTPTWPLYSR